MGGLGIRLERAAEGKKNDVMGCAHSPFPLPFPIRVFPSHCLSFLVVILKTWRISSSPQPTYENQAHEHVLDEGGIDKVPEPAPMGQQEMDERRAGPQGIAQPGPELSCKQREGLRLVSKFTRPQRGAQGTRARVEIENTGCIPGKEAMHGVRNGAQERG